MTTSGALAASTGARRGDEVSVCMVLAHPHAPAILGAPSSLSIVAGPDARINVARDERWRKTTMTSPCPPAGMTVPAVMPCRVRARGMSMRRSIHGPTNVRLAAVVAVLLASATVLVAPNRVRAATPIDGGAITIFPVSINSSVGTDEYDPHVSGDIVSYTASDKVRYYDFFSGDDAQVPSPLGDTDLLSDVSNGRIVFTRVETSGQLPVMQFDIPTAAATKVYPRPTEQQFGAAIGSSTVAFVDLNASPQGELVVGTVGGPLTQVTADTRTDQSPSIAPLGNLVVYESCGATCDIRQAAWNGSSWAIGTITTTPEEEHNPDTDGTLIVYDAIRSGESDIAWQP